MSEEAVEGSYANLQRADALCDLERYPEALDLLRGVLAAEPDNLHAWCLTAQAQLGLGDSKSGLASARRSLELSPDDEWAHRLLGLAHAQVGDYAAAADAAREAVRCAPYEPAGYIQLAHWLAERRGRRDEAQAAAARAVELAPDDPHAHIAVGAVAASAGKRDEAAAAFERALAIDPENTVAHHELARMRLGRRSLIDPRGLAAAAAGFATAVRTDPKDPTSSGNLEYVLRSFLSITTYFIFLDAFIIVRFTNDSGGAVSRLLPVALLIVPAAFAQQFIAGLPPELRQRLVRLPAVAMRVKAAAVVVGVALLAIVIGAFAPESARPALAGTAVLTALIGRILLAIERDKVAVATSRGRAHMVSTPIMVTLAVCLALLTLILLAATVGANGSALAILIVLAIGCAAATALTTRAILRRRR